MKIGLFLILASGHTVEHKYFGRINFLSCRKNEDFIPQLMLIAFVVNHNQTKANNGFPETIVSLCRYVAGESSGVEGGGSNPVPRVDQARYLTL